MGFATDCIHAGQEPDPSTGAIITPHMAGTTIESQTKAAKISCKLIKRYWKQEGE